MQTFISQADWFITKTAASEIAFGDDSDSEIVATFNVSTSQASSTFMAVNFLEIDTCNSTLFDDYFNSTIFAAVDTDDNDYKNVPVGIAIDKDDVTTSLAWTWKNDTNAALEFCTRVDLVTGSAFDGLADSIGGPIADTIAQSIGYVKVMYSLDIDMSSNFEVSIDVEETLDAANEESQATQVTYTVIACQCTLSDKVCLDEESISALNQNDLLNICVYPEESDIIIRSVEAFALVQGELAVTFITGDDVNALTTVAGEGEKTVSISTVVISAFFINPTPLTAAGTAVLSFGDTDGARQLASIGGGASVDGRQMQAGGEGTGAFDVSAELVPLGASADEVENIDPSSALMVDVHNGAFATFAMAAVAGLM